MYNDDPWLKLIDDLLSPRMQPKKKKTAPARNKHRIQRQIQSQFSDPTPKSNIRSKNTIQTPVEEDRDSPGIWKVFNATGRWPKVYLGVASITALAAGTTSYSPGPGFEKRVSSLGLLCRVAARG